MASLVGFIRDKYNSREQDRADAKYTRLEKKEQELTEKIEKLQSSLKGPVDPTQVNANIKELRGRVQEIHDEKLKALAKALGQAPRSEDWDFADYPLKKPEAEVQAQPDDEPAPKPDEKVQAKSSEEATVGVNNIARSDAEAPPSSGKAVSEGHWSRWSDSSEGEKVLP